MLLTRENIACVMLERNELVTTYLASRLISSEKNEKNIMIVFIAFCKLSFQQFMKVLKYIDFQSE